MASSQYKIQVQNTLELLKNLYPHLFTDVHKELKPLHWEVFNKVIQDFHLKQLSTVYLAESFEFYKNIPAYLKKVAIGIVYIDMNGEAKDSPSLTERNYARKKLIKRNLWSNKLEKIYQYRYQKLLEDSGITTEI